MTVQIRFFFFFESTFPLESSSLKCQSSFSSLEFVRNDRNPEHVEVMAN